MTGILDRLERRGLIGRGARPGDRRAVQIQLTGVTAIADRSGTANMST